MPIAKNRLIDGCTAKRTAELLVQADAPDPCELRVVTVVPASRPKLNFSHRSLLRRAASSCLPTTYPLTHHPPTYLPICPPAYLPTHLAYLCLHAYMPTCLHSPTLPDPL